MRFGLSSRIVGKGFSGKSLCLFALEIGIDVDVYKMLLIKLIFFHVHL